MPVLPHRRWFVVLAALCLLSLYGTAQELLQRPGSASPPDFQIIARLVVLDVVVTDHSGQLRNNLTRDDFRITEDGVPQTILNFEPPSDHPVPTGSPIASTQDLENRAPQSPVDIIVLDEMNTRFQDMAFARYALKKFLNAQPQQMQAPTMLIAVNFDRFIVLHDYTQDRGEILRALDHHLTHYPWNLERGENKYMNFAKSLGALEQVAEGTRGHPGHKNIMWVGKGFPGIDLSSPAVPQPVAAGVTYAMQQAVNMLRDSRVTLYTIDPTILTSTIATTTDADSVVEAGDSMDATAPDPFVGDVNFTGLAKATGGKSFYSRNDVDREIGESVRDGVNYYTIAYRPASDSDASRDYRKIRVALTLPGLHAFYRDGYFARTNQATAAPGLRTQYDLAAAEASTLIYTGLSVVAAAKPGASDVYLVGVPENQLTWSITAKGPQAAKLMVVAAAVNNRGEVLRRSTEEVTAHRPDKVEAPANAGGLVRMEVSLPYGPNTYRLRFVVYSESDGRLGTADIPIPGAAPGKNIR
jgi:VWFA-related protein